MIRAAVLAWLLAAAPAAAGGPLDGAAAVLDRAEGIDALMLACPADVFGERQSWWSGLFGAAAGLGLEACRDDPAGCARLCAADGSGETCFSLARLFETEGGGGSATELLSRKAHALSCALGYPAGCTNRGGGIRNYPLPGDPWAQQPLAQVESCLLRSFDLACTEADSWGCAMLGQAHELGQGTLADPGLARDAYRRACALVDDPEFSSCAFSRRALATLSD